MCVRVCVSSVFIVQLIQNDVTRYEIKVYTAV